MSIEKKVAITQVPCKELPEPIVVCVYAYTNEGSYPRAGYIAAFHTKDGREHVLTRDLRYHYKDETYIPAIDSQFLLDLASDEALFAVGTELIAAAVIGHFVLPSECREQPADPIYLLRKQAHRGTFERFRRHLIHSEHVTQDLRDLTKNVSNVEEAPEWSAASNITY